jgi:formylglycine-generating enzyme required for sulfatase activity
MTFVLVPAGELMMGSPQGEQGRENDEGLHRVTIGQPFWMGKYEVTQEQWEAVMGNNRSHFRGAKNPVEFVSWNEIQGFLQKFNGGRAGGGLALPTEAQWEYACRAGTSTRFCSGDEDAGLGAYAWHGDNSQSRTHAVGQKRANAWGLHDMHGNVWEWCASPYVPQYDGREQKGAEAGGGFRVLRGGSWHGGPRYCRSARRGRAVTGPRDYGRYGFRVIRSARTSE